MVDSLEFLYHNRLDSSLQFFFKTAIRIVFPCQRHKGHDTLTFQIVGAADDRGFGYSDEGQLIGHILIALRMIDEKARLVPGFPPKLKLLVEHLVAREAPRIGREVREVSAAAMAEMQAWHWPGNVRELRNAVERAVLLAEGALLRPEDFSFAAGRVEESGEFRLPAAGVRFDGYGAPVDVPAAQRADAARYRELQIARDRNSVAVLLRPAT